MASLGQITLNEIELHELDADPTISGVSAPDGSLGVLTDGTAIYQKISGGPTAWRLIGDGSSGSGDYYPNFLQYTNINNQTTTSTTGQILGFLTNQNSVPGTLLTQVSTTDYRTDYNGYVKISYYMNAYNTNNDRGVSVFINKNGSKIVWTEKIGVTAGGTLSGGRGRNSSVAGCFILTCAVNDIFTFSFRRNEGSGTATLESGDGVVKLEVFSVNP